MLKSVMLVTVIAAPFMATDAEAAFICQPEVDSGVSTTLHGDPEFNIGLNFVIGKSNCDQLQAKADKAAAQAREAAQEVLEAEVDTLLKRVKLFDQLSKSCETTGHEAVCAKAIEVGNSL